MPNEHTRATAIQATGKSRIEWVDLARGLGIFLVVFGHVLGGLQSNAWFEQARTCDFVMRFIYAFHMPLFFFLAGVFAPLSLARGKSAFLADKLATIAWPYVLWSIIQGSAQVVLSGVTNNSLGLEDLLRIAYHPIAQFWFLYTLFLIHLIYALLASRQTGKTLFLAVALVLLAVDAAGHGPSWEMGNAVFHSIIYYAAGVALTGSVRLQGMPRLTMPYLLGACLLGYAVVACAVWARVTPVRWIDPWVAASGAAATIALGLIMERSRACSWTLRLWGRASLQIFVAHTIIAAGCRVLLEKILGYHGLIGNLVLGTALGIWLPVMLALLAPRLGIEWLFAAPGSRYKMARAVTA